MSEASNHRFQPPLPSRQVAFHQLLQGARQEWLEDALQEALEKTSPSNIRAQLTDLVPDDVAAILAAGGIRDEYVFPTPALLEMQPTLLGYYRLLLGVSQKAFYRTGTGFSRFKTMETSGTLNAFQRQCLPNLCAAFAGPLSDLIRQLSPTVTARDVRELPLLTLGAQFQGGNNVAIGKQATQAIFLTIRDLVEGHIFSHSESSFVMRNSAGRSVRIVIAGDPDVRILEEFDGGWDTRVAIEIKGGTDQSNVHNRAGEAEKSHQKAKQAGFRDFWTVILKRGVDMAALRSESPTTNSWFDISAVLAREGDDWIDFRNRLAGVVGIPLV
jgi:hypothetical protein